MYKKIVPFILSFTLIFSLEACKKDHSAGTNGPLDGTWVISSMHINSSSTVAFPGPGLVDSTIEVTDFTSSAGAGKLTISSGIMYPNELSCTGPYTDYFTEYQNHALVQNDTSARTASVSGSSNVVFELVGTDSIYFAEGPFVDLATVAGTGLGGTYTLNDNVITMVLNLDQTGTSNDVNETGTVRKAGTATIALTKQ